MPGGSIPERASLVSTAYGPGGAPLPRNGIATLFMTHPPIQERIRRLRALDGTPVVRLAA